MSTSIYNTLVHMDTQTNRLNFERGQRNLGSDRLDKHAFLQLMMTKLKLQNPLNPVEDSDFMMQQASMAQVEKLDDLLSYLQGNSLLTQASSMVGKKVDIQQMDGSTITGVIDSISFANGTAKINVNGVPYAMDQVVKMYGSTT